MTSKPFDSVLTLRRTYYCMPVYTQCLQHIGMGTVPSNLKNFEKTINEAILNRLEEQLVCVPINASSDEAFIFLMDNCPEFQTVTTFRL